jgi:hypothetical protein
MNLVQFLSKLNSCDRYTGIWVNPSNLDEYRVGMFELKNGGLDDDWICIGSLERLNFREQSVAELMREVLQKNGWSLQKPDVGSFFHRGKPIRVSISATTEAFVNRKLDKDFYETLHEEVVKLKEEWSELDAEQFVNQEVRPIIGEHLMSLDREPSMSYDYDADWEDCIIRACINSGELL